VASSLEAIPKEVGLSHVDKRYSCTKVHLLGFDDAMESTEYGSIEMGVGIPVKVPKGE
jgi:hypothetical protein